MLGLSAAHAEGGASSGREPNVDDTYNEGCQSCVNILAGGAVLLKNEGGFLALGEGVKVTILGSMSCNYMLGGAGSAGGGDENTVMLNDAMIEAGLDVNSSGWDWLAQQCGGRSPFSPMVAPRQSSSSSPGRAPRGPVPQWTRATRVCHLSNTLDFPISVPESPSRSASFVESQSPCPRPGPDAPMAGAETAPEVLPARWTRRCW